MTSIWRSLFAGAASCALALQFAAAEAAQPKETVLHSFSSDDGDGWDPFTSVLDVAGTLYGTTLQGGAANSGTVFTLDPKSGAETVLHSFGTGVDGANPDASLIDVKGTLYGTTDSGGANGSYGTVFSLDLDTGMEQVLYSFCSHKNCTDGQHPSAGLIDVKEALYGTTVGGGIGRGGNCDNGGCGTVFSLDMNTGTETVLHSFCSREYCPDGAYPGASLIDAKGTLYGTTGKGGSRGCGGYGCGTVFALDPNTGIETVIYSFCNQANCKDGAEPEASLIDVKGTLYGTTSNGGDYGHGTVFAINPTTGSETVIYSFEGRPDGALPVASLIHVKSTLYGTTLSGGTNNIGRYCSKGCGTLFAFDLNTGVERVLYSFCSQQNCTDGDKPNAAMIDVKGVLYGTTGYGGAFDFGTVFKLKMD